jgi:hypothetical protein
MARKPAPKPRPSPDLTPDSLPGRDQSDTVVPDNVRRRDEPDMTPDSLPRRDQERTLEGRAPAPDGGVAQHPIHDEDLEDLGPGDYQRQIDEVEERGIDREDAVPLDRVLAEREPRR